MKIQREQIVFLIKNKIFRSPKTFLIDKLREELCVVGKFTVVDFNNIANGETFVSELEDAELYWIVDTASKYLDTIKTADNYFEDAEISRYSRYVKSNDGKITYPLVFEDAVKLAENQYAFPCTIGKLAKLKHNGLLEVDPEFQRNSETDKYGSIRVYTNPRRIKQLSECYQNFYAMNGVRFNLMDDGVADFEYDEDSKELVVRDGTIIIPDGNHRILATELINQNNPCAENSFIVFFTFLPAIKVKEVISQEWNTQPINKSHKSSMKLSNANKIVDSIKRNPNSDTIYTDKIVTTMKEIQHGNGFILYDILSKSIEKYYATESLETQDERTEVAEWLSKFFNRLTVLMLEDFKNYQTVKKTRWSVSHYAFVGYVQISSHIKGMENWREELKRIVDSVDFSIEQSPLEHKVVKNNEKCMEIFFEGVLKNAGII